MEFRVYYRDRTIDDSLELIDGIQAVLCKRRGEWFLLRLGEAPGWVRCGYMALKDGDAVEWHETTDRGAQATHDLRPAIFLGYWSGLDCLDREYDAVMEQAVADLHRLRSS